MNNDGSNIKRVTNTSLDATSISPVWMPIDSSTSINEGKIPPQTFQLYQNYPNPFNPKTKIKYSIPIRSFVSLRAYDLLGNEIVTLASGEKPAGSYDIEFSAIGLPSGIYFYQLKTGKYSSTKKMLLLK
jgi:hypothetical protein